MPSTPSLVFTEAGSHGRGAILIHIFKGLCWLLLYAENQLGWAQLLRQKMLAFEPRGAARWSSEE